MGFIGERQNDHAIVSSNLRLTMAVADAARAAGALVVYTSSACVYPDALQQSPECAPLREEDAGVPPSDAYGWEKLAGERVLTYALQPDQVRIARLHNVYGPDCTWQGGREKAPAALLRKALAQSLTPGAARATIEVWGDGEQTRTYLYVDDCVDALVRLASVTSGGAPAIVNIGSDHLISVNALAEMALRVAGVRQDVAVAHTPGPQGVRGRNCDFARAAELLQWRPSIALEEGLARTAEWIRRQMEAELDTAAPSDKRLAAWRQSHTALAGSGDEVSFGLLLPITSRGCSEAAFWDGLGSTTAQLAASVRHDPLWPSMRVVVGLDDDDPLLGVGCAGRSRLLALLRQRVAWLGDAAGERAVTAMSLSAFPPGAICAYWDAMAKEARRLKCTHFLLLGDDVEIKTPGWMTAVTAAFAQLAQRSGLPLGFGCVAFTDTSFPGFPTFPIVTAVHMDILGGDLLPPGAFVNQDADPFLFQLYRRWGASVMLPDARLVNTVGGAGDARYAKRAATWTGKVLDGAVAAADAWLKQYKGGAFADAATCQRQLVVDIAIPTYRCNLELLRPMLTLPAPEGVSLGYIVIVDRPRTEARACLEALEAEFGDDWRYRLRCQETNTGAPSARNRALNESAADYVLFLDDDVVPSRDIVERYVAAVRAHPEARGFAGPTFFPPIVTARALGARLAGVTYFWDLPAAAPVVPWAVTANVLLRRLPGVSFDLCFPATGGKTPTQTQAHCPFSTPPPSSHLRAPRIPLAPATQSHNPSPKGGEDIDFCLKVADGRLVAVPEASAVHPWWNDGHPPLGRFWGWAFGDGALIGLYPKLTYLAPPNAVEALLLAPLGLVALGLGGRVWPWLPRPTLRLGWVALLGLMVGECVSEAATHLVLERGRHREDGPLSLRLAAVPHALAVRLASEAGRAYGHLVRAQPGLLLRRFDWFVGLHPTVAATERGAAAQRMACWLLAGTALRILL